jgi:membrane fusion protein, adhesin transport system
VITNMTEETKTQAVTVTPVRGQAPKWDEVPETLPAMRAVRTPGTPRVLAAILLLMMLVFGLALIVTPWQQNVVGSGRVSALDPNQRQQNIETPVDGRIIKWHVIEGAEVKAGDLLVELSDNDPSIMENLGRERSAISETIRAGRDRLTNLQDRIRGIEMTRTNAVSAAESRVQMAKERVRAAEQGLQAAEAAHTTAKLNIERQKRLGEKGLTSTRNIELAELELARTLADVDRAGAALNASRSEQLAMEAELLRTDNDAQVRIEEARAALQSAFSDLGKQNAELTKVDVRVARQLNQQVRAPVDGTILRILARQGGEQVKAADALAVLVPRAGSDIVELWVNGNDAPLISPGRKVRLQFEGWPAIQFAGWPSVAVGTFGGRVLFVDATDNGQGKFRVLVEPDPDDRDWPARRFLRQGVRANGWVLLNQVPIWFELWRQFNAFPPSIAMEEPGSEAKSSRGGKNGK